MARTAAPITNRLLDRLPARERAHFIGACDRVEMEFGQVLDQPGGTIKHVYFPVDGFVSLLAYIGGTQVIEVALAGNEGMYGLPAAFGIKVSPVRGLVQGAGSAYRMEPGAFRTHLTRTPSLRASIDRYSHAVMSQLMQTAGCNRFHVVEQRLARWLLMTADRAHSLTLRITHEFLAYMLGVRRVGITEAAGALQREGLITYSRGALTILDRKGLERAACACYRNDLESYARALV